MQRVEFIRDYWKGEFHLGAYVDWRDARADGVELGVKLGLWSFAVKFFAEKSLADRMVETLKKY